MSTQTPEAFAALLGACEYIGNSTSGNLHGFHGDVVTAARQAVKAAGGELRAMGWFKAGEAEKMSYEERERMKAQRFLAKMEREGMVWSLFREHWVSIAQNKEDEAAHAGADI